MIKIALSPVDQQGSVAVGTSVFSSMKMKSNSPPPPHLYMSVCNRCVSGECIPRCACRRQRTVFACLPFHLKAGSPCGDIKQVVLAHSAMDEVPLSNLSLPVGVLEFQALLLLPPAFT